MAGTKVLMSPTSLMMLHNPFTIAIGDSEEMQKAIGMLNEVKESIINAYEIKTGLSRTRLSHLMDAETWLNANKAIELGFADAIMFKPGESSPQDSFVFSRRAVANSLLDKLKKPIPKQSTEPLYERLNLLKY
jgi:ATP-dependent Clp protease protease subunit